MAQQFTIDLDSEPTALASLHDALAAHHVDLRSIGVAGVAKTSVVIITNDHVATRQVLYEQEYRFSEGEIVMTSVADEPGALARVVRQVSDAGIRLCGLSLLRWRQGKAELAISSDNPSALREVLSGSPLNRLGATAWSNGTYASRLGR